MDDYELMECIEEGLSIFGQSVCHTVYWRLAYLNNLPYDGILVNPEAFVEGLQSIFGSGARQIEGVIIGKIRERFGLIELQSDSLSYVIRYIRRQIIYV